MGTALRRVPRWLRWIAVAVPLLLVAFSSFSWHCMNGNPVSPRKMEALELGMSEAEVRDLLGSPKDQFQRPKSGTDWTYSRSFMWRSLVVEFDETGHLSDFHMDN